MGEVTRSLYPEIKPFEEGRLKVSDLHELHYEICGNPDGKPIVFLHGGPGGGVEPGHRRFFDPKIWKVFLFDQRGCGKSTPYAELQENTTWDLVADIERLREHLGVERWTVFGGSWGSTLALAYAQTHPDRCLGLILRGIFTLRRKELLWFYQSGTSEIFPEAWEKYLAPIPVEERGDLMAAYYKRLTSEDEAVRLEAAGAWSAWEGATSRLIVDAAMIKKYSAPKHAEAFARIEAHYFVNKGFFKTDDQLFTGINVMRNIPGVIIQGQYDIVCPPVTAWDLHKVWPEARFRLIPASGHSVSEEGIRSALIEETDRFAKE
ncbi:MAG: prolyl aminopeptidase [Elusimicrobia bacterium]|nr:MAG: prolyl aminopeptidase [Elusimicrobiota bacterium]